MKNIQYKDFAPQVTEKQFWKGNQYENMDKVIERVNEWMRKNYQNNIINIETISLSISRNLVIDQSMHKLHTGGGIVHMLQIVRVWYS